MTFGEKITKLRKEKDYSQDYVAAMLDVSRQSVSKWECDKAYPTLDKIKQLGTLYEVRPSQLIDNDEITADDEEKTNTAAVISLIKHKQNIGTVFFIVGLIIIVGLYISCLLFPANVRVKQTRTVSRDEIVVLNGDYDSFPEEWQSPNIIRSTGNIIAFLNTYYLHWLFFIGCFMFVFGAVNLSVAEKRRRLVLNFKK